MSIINKILALLIVISISGLAYFYIENIRLTENLGYAQNNAKALLLNIDSVNSINRTLKLNIESLNYYNDSLSQKLSKTLEERKIDKRKVEQLQYLLSTTKVTDTLLIKDTVFVENTNIDTCLTDNKWYSISLKLIYPNIVEVSPTFKNEYTTVFSYKKETINPPKKCFIGRWFQKKHIVTETLIITDNPYSTIDTTRVIENIKL
jgi:hypothetical protein